MQPKQISASQLEKRATEACILKSTSSRTRTSRKSASSSPVLFIPELNYPSLTSRLALLLLRRPLLEPEARSSYQRPRPGRNESEGTALTIPPSSRVTWPTRRSPSRSSEALPVRTARSTSVQRRICSQRRPVSLCRNDELEREGRGNERMLAVRHAKGHDLLGTSPARLEFGRIELAGTVSSKEGRDVRVGRIRPACRGVTERR